MSEKNTVIRSLHDVGLAAWFGGALMGAVGLNGAAANAKDPKERLSLSADGWKRWSPVSAAAIGVHGVGGLGLILANQGRLGQQPGVKANTATKLGLTVVAAALTAWSGKLGRDVEKHSHEGAPGATEASGSASPELKRAQTQLKYTQWAIPALTGTLLVMGAQQGEQQRPQSLVANQLKRLPGNLG